MSNKYTSKYLASILAVTTIMSTLTATAFADTADNSVPEINVTAVADETTPEANIHTITVNGDIDNGTASTSAVTAKVGSTVTVTPEPNENYVLESITVTDGAGKNVPVEDGKFIMPDSNVTVNVTFKSDSDNPIEQSTLKKGPVTVIGKLPVGAKLASEKIDRNSSSFGVTVDIVDDIGNVIEYDANTMSAEISVALENDFANASSIYVYSVEKAASRATTTDTYTKLKSMVSGQVVSFDSALPGNFVISTVELDNTGAFVDAKEIDAAKTELNTYISGLKVETTNCDDATKTAFNDAMKKAQAIVEDKNATFEEVKTASDTLKNLVNIINKSNTDAAKTNLKKLVDETKIDEKQHTAESYKIYSEAFAKAKDVLAKEDVTVDEINKAITDFEAAVAESNTKAIKAAKDALQKSIDSTKFEESQVTKAYTDALNAAKNVIANKDATLDAVTKAATDFQTAIDTIDGTLVTKSKTALQKLIDDNKVDQSQCSADLYKAYTTAVNNAKTVIASDKATSEDVKRVSDDLTKALNNIEVYRVDTAKNSLQNTINSLNIDANLYTPDSYKTFSDALNKAKNVIANKDAKLGEINIAANNLNGATNSLVKLTNGGNSGTSGNGGNAVSGKPDDNNKPPYTGVASSIVGITVCAGCAAAVVVGKARKRRK